jgi:glycosyltransferase involved in cell wall biosynthesis
VSKPVLSVTTIVRDEAERLPAMVRSARPVAEEILLVDTGSTDGTPELARQLGCRVVHFGWCDDFAAARNAGLDQVRGEWVLVLDADDRLLPDGVTVVRRCIGWGRAKLRELDLLGYSLGIEERTLDSQQLGVAASSCRLWPRSRRVRYVGRVHEQPRDLSRPERPRTALLPGVHVAHVGYDPSRMPAKYARNERLLRLRLEDDPSDHWAMFFLAMQKRDMGQTAEAAEWAGHAILIGEFPPEVRRQLEAMNEDPEEQNDDDDDDDGSAQHH